jgi:Chaperone of endosialidase
MVDLKGDRITANIDIVVGKERIHIVSSLNQNDPIQARALVVNQSNIIASAGKIIGGRGIISGSDIIVNNGVVKANDILINSSQELKQDISTLTKEEAYSLIGKLEPIKFSFNNDPSKKQNIGFIAEQVPDIVADDDHSSIRYIEIISALTKVVKELKNEVDGLKEKINK